MTYDKNITALEKKAEMIEWVIDTMVSEEHIPEEKLTAFRQWLSEWSDAVLKSEGLSRAVNKLAILGFGRSDIDEKSEVARERWRSLAESLGMNPELNHYRSIREARNAAAKKRILLRRRALRAAAVLLPAALVAGLYLWSGREQGSSAVFAATHSVASLQDSILHIALADGTQITLNRNSTFSYNDSREGELSGEAYFRIAEDPAHPFVIHSGDLKVTVLGTEFNLQTYESEGRSTLSLYEGKVRLEHSAGTNYLEEAGKEFSIDHATSRTVIRDFNIAEQPEWLADGNLYHFHSLGDIFRSIENEYGVGFENMSSIDTTQRLSFRPKKGVSLETLMSVLKEASNEFCYKINERTITLYP